MKNLVFVIESLHLGGAEKSLIAVLQNIDYTLYNVDLILFKKGGLFFNQVPVEVKIIQKEMPRLSIYSRIIYKLNRIQKSARFHNAQLFWPLMKNGLTVHPARYDIAVAYNQGFATYFVSEFIAANKKIAWLNTDYKKAGYNIHFDYPFYKNFTEVVAVSPQVKNNLSLELDKINKQVLIKVIKDITDNERVRRLSQEHQNRAFELGKINIVTVGRLAKPKGLSLAIASCKILIDKGYLLNWFVVGEGPERKKLEAQIKKSNLDKTFFLLGEKENPYPYMKACDIYTQTSIFEGLPLTLVEASYLNKPIVTTDFDSASDIIVDGKTGLIAEMNPQSIATKIEFLILNQHLRQEFAANLAKQEDRDKEESLEKIGKLYNS